MTEEEVLLPCIVFGPAYDIELQPGERAVFVGLPDSAALTLVDRVHSLVYARSEPIGKLLVLRDVTILMMTDLLGIEGLVRAELVEPGLYLIIKPDKRDAETIWREVIKTALTGLRNVPDWERIMVDAVSGLPDGIGSIVDELLGPT